MTINSQNNMITNPVMLAENITLREEVIHKEIIAQKNHKRFDQESSKNQQGKAKKN